SQSPHPPLARTSKPASSHRSTRFSPHHCLPTALATLTEPRQTIAEVIAAYPREGSTQLGGKSGPPTALRVLWGNGDATMSRYDDQHADHDERALSIAV